MNTLGINGQPQQPAPQPQGMVIENPLAGPADTGWILGIAMLPNGKQQVLLQLISAASWMKADLDPDTAETLGNNLIAAARQARSGLVIPQGITLNQQMNGHGQG